MSTFITIGNDIFENGFTRVWVSLNSHDLCSLNSQLFSKIYGGNVQGNQARLPHKRIATYSGRLIERAKLVRFIFREVFNNSQHLKTPLKNVLFLLSVIRVAYILWRVSSDLHWRGIRKWHHRKFTRMSERKYVFCILLFELFKTQIRSILMISCVVANNIFGPFW